MGNERLYRVSFHNRGQVYEIYARGVSHGAMVGFVEVEGLVFGENSSVLIDPAAEKLKAEFANVERTYLPIHSVIRIDQVDRPGKAAIHAAGGESGRVTLFPGRGDGQGR